MGGDIAQWQSIRLQIERSPVQLRLSPSFWMERTTYTNIYTNQYYVCIKAGLCEAQSEIILPSASGKRASWSIWSTFSSTFTARLAQSVEHETLNLRVVGSSPTLGEKILKVNISIPPLWYSMADKWIHVWNIVYLAQKTLINCLPAERFRTVSVLRCVPKKIVRRPGIEPGSQEWESCMIPLHQRRR